MYVSSTLNGDLLKYLHNKYPVKYVLILLRIKGAEKEYNEIANGLSNTGSKFDGPVLPMPLLNIEKK